MDETLNTGSDSWATTVQDWGTTLLNKWSDAQYVKPYDIQALQLQALGNGGYYREGQPGARPAAQGLSITPGILLLGVAAIVAVMVLKD